MKRSWFKLADFLSATLFLEGSALNFSSPKFLLQKTRQMKASQNKKSNDSITKTKHLYVTLFSLTKILGLLQV